jgi:hypothetical protein
VAFLSAMIFGLVVLSDSGPTRLVCTGSVAETPIYAKKGSTPPAAPRKNPAAYNLVVDFLDKEKPGFGAAQLSGHGIDQKFFLISEKKKDLRAFFGGGMGGIFNTPNAKWRTGFGRLSLIRATGALEFEITYKSPKTKAKSGLKSLSFKGQLTCKSTKDGA